MKNCWKGDVFAMKTPENYKFLGIDIGTTSLKAAVFDGTGKRLSVRAVD